VSLGSSTKSRAIRCVVVSLDPAERRRLCLLPPLPDTAARSQTQLSPRTTVKITPEDVQGSREIREKKATARHRLICEDCIEDQAVAFGVTSARHMLNISPRDDFLGLGIVNVAERSVVTERYGTERLKLLCTML
jgi:hypothetical protein